jgi:hypothetical protein
MCVYIRIGKRERRRLENALPLGYNSRAQYQVHRSRGGGGGIGSFGCCWPKSKWIQPLPTAGGKEKRHTTGNKIIKKSRKILWGGFFPFLLSGKIETFLKRKKGIEINPSFSLVNPVNFLLDLWPPSVGFFSRRFWELFSGIQFLLPRFVVFIHNYTVCIYTGTTNVGRGG